MIQRPGSRRLCQNGFGLTSFLLICLLATSADAQVQTAKLVELTEKETKYEGKIVSKSDEYIWLMQRDGWLRRLKVADITDFRKISDKFVPFTAGELRDRLRRELRGLEVVGTGQYLVAGPPKVVRDYAQVFEDQYRAFRGYFSVRGFDVPTPEFPLVAIVFPDLASFAKNAKNDGTKVSQGLKGYYMPASNRISLFHEQPVSTTSRQIPGEILLRNDSEFPTAASLSPGSHAIESIPWGSTEGNLESTMIHEATHQVAFNTGIHNRLGTANPRWFVEGLATAFEAPGMRNSSLQRTAGAKLNQNRLAQFREFVKLRRKPKSLEVFVENGNLTDLNVLDGYAQSWALTYFLIETRSRDYAKYVKLISKRSPQGEYTDQDRLADFREAFGSDLVLLEAKFLRYLEQVK